MKSIIVACHVSEMSINKYREYCLKTEAIWRTRYIVIIRYNVNYPDHFSKIFPRNAQRKFRQNQQNRACK